jgi:hypothetical protein
MSPALHFRMQGETGEGCAKDGLSEMALPVKGEPGSGQVLFSPANHSRLRKLVPGASWQLVDGLLFMIAFPGAGGRGQMFPHGRHASGRTTALVRRANAKPDLSDLLVGTAGGAVGMWKLD